MIPARPVLKRSKSIEPLKQQVEELTPPVELLKPVLEEEILTPSPIEEELVLIVPEKRREYKMKNRKRHLFYYKQKERSKLKSKS